MAWYDEYRQNAINQRSAPGYQANKEALWTQKLQSEGRLPKNDFSPFVLDILRGHNLQGTPFDPSGNPAFSQNMAKRFSRYGRDRQLAAVTAADLEAPDDPYARGFARLKARQGAENEAGRAFSDFQNNSAMDYMHGLWGLLGQGYGGELGANQAAANRNFQAWLQEYADRQARGMLPYELGGELLGAGVGALGGKKK